MEGFIFYPAMKKPKPTSAVETEAAHLRALFSQSRFVEAELAARKLLNTYPRVPFFANALGNVQKELGKLAESLKSYVKATEIDPSFHEAWTNAGHVALALQDMETALEYFTRALTLAPASPEAHFGLAKVMQLIGDTTKAEAAYKKAIDLKPDFSLAYNNLGCLYQDSKQLQKSEACLRKALEIDPSSKEVVLNLAVTFGKQGKHEQAEDYCRRAISLDPGNYSAHNNLGKILCDSGKLESALTCYRDALKLAPEKLSVFSNLLFTLNYLEHASPESLYNEAIAFGLAAAKQASTPYTSWLADKNSKRLRIGLVTGDLINHPVGYFLESILRQLNPDDVELIAFPTHSRTDSLTLRVQPFLSEWLPLTALEDSAAAALIHSKGIHILVDLAGHTGHNRLPLFAWKPAPVQVSWLGYFATTGIKAIDYLLADEAGVMQTQQQFFTEQIEYLPTRLCFTAPDAALKPSALPALKSKWITFGCFQKLSKITDQVLQVWSQLLASIPSGRLYMQCQSFNDALVCNDFKRRLLAFDIDPQRVRLHGETNRHTYLERHQDIDFLLDTFPYTGGTTTCEALWMGVPTLTLAGTSLLARQGVSILTAAGLEEWIAQSPEEYVQKAQAISTDLPALAKLRTELRQRVLASPLFDAAAFARNLELACSRMWLRHLQKLKTNLTQT